MNEQLTQRLKACIECHDETLWGLIVDVFNKCVVGKVREPEGTLQRRWLQAGTGENYYGQWLWDTMFLLDLLAIFPENNGLIREVFQNYWDFQERWNAVKPAYAHDMVPCMIQPANVTGWVEYPAFSQIPILAWGLERVYRRNGDQELLRQCLAPLERFHEWYWRERDVANSGLVSVGSYNGDIQHARFETFDFECNLDDLKLTPHPVRRDEGLDKWYGDVCLPGITAYLVTDERCLQRLARVLGDTDMIARRAQRIEKSVAAVNRHMWNEEQGTFLAVNRDSLEQIPVATIGSWMPLMAEIPTKAMAARMAEAFMTESWQTPLPIPTVDRKDKRWAADGFWRGDVWPAPNYQVAAGFVQYGYQQIAADIADKTVANILKNGISEHYNSITGKPLGVPFLGMSCSIVTMLLDGITRRYQARGIETR